MISIPKGWETIRTFRDEVKWISSNYQMGIPSRGRNQKESVRVEDLDAFLISKFQVTNELFRTVLNADQEISLDDNKPKVDVSWFDAVQFCNSISRFFGLEEYYLLVSDSPDVTIDSESDGFRLPTDAEWQYACRCMTDEFQYSDIDQIAWYKGNSGNEVHPVGEKVPNAWGLYDMLGNVWEWCWDYYDQTAYRSYRVFRGGGFADDARVCGSTTRKKSHPSFGIDDLGFRLARSVSSTTDDS